MTQQPDERRPAPRGGDAWDAYGVALAAIVAAAAAETGKIVDRLVPDGALLEDLTDRTRSLLVVALVRSWARWRARAWALASIQAAAWVIEQTGTVPRPVPPPPFTSADRDRLTRAAETVLDRAATGRADEAARLAVIEAQREAERVEAEFDAELAAEVEQARREQVADDERALRDAAREVEQSRREVAEQVAAEAADAEQAAAAADAEQERADARQRAADEQALRRERREAQRRRIERVARGEAAEGAAEALPVVLGPTAGVVGWARELDPNPCDRCRAWWLSGGEPRSPTPVRPWSVRMKRHNGCCCVQRPITAQEATVRGYTTEPEPTLRTKRTQDAAAARHRRR